MENKKLIDPVFLILIFLFSCCQEDGEAGEEKGDGGCQELD